MNRYVCIHGHFYQPPRESPWTGEIERQEGAAPFHDWNERISAECYEPNASARILDGGGAIAQQLNNYSRISFNFGPTLLSWLERKRPAVYGAIRTADRESARRFSGHGSAIAQAYNHVILPLANARDKRTQIVWGIRDFEHCFGRKPEGLWLPETAVDRETLEILTEEGIRFTILAPHQAARVRKEGGAWREVVGEAINPRHPYLQRLPSGRSIALFFYDGPVSRAVAFENLLSDGRNFSDRLMGVFDNSSPAPQLAHIATDGETYGHHHKFGEMALAYALDSLEKDPDVRLANYGEYLEKHPPTSEVEIREGTSWSCAHGVERWRSDCGCNTGKHPAWNQSWRGPLREALDWLRDQGIPSYERAANRYFQDPWAARDDFISLLLDNSYPAATRFFSRHATRALTTEEMSEAFELLEIQRWALFMYTSCGWFFDDPSETGTIQILRYAGRVIELSEKRFGLALESGFLSRLEAAKSNNAEFGNTRRIYELKIKPEMAGAAVYSKRTFL
ncbi:MAG: DUF3536 domain-containing protein [Bdellovibrionota bacterium]